MKSRSPFAKKAIRRRIYNAAKRRAPKHPPAPESRLRHAAGRLFIPYHREIVRKILLMAPSYLRHRKQRHDAEAPKPATSALKSIFASLWDEAANKLHESTFQRVIREASQKTANSVRAQTASATGTEIDEDVLAGSVNEMGGDITDMMEGLLGDSLERAEDVLAEWADLDPDYSERAEDPDALAEMLDDGLGGILGKALMGASLIFGAAFADMVKGAQQDAGIEHYMWITQNDTRVRPAHADLDGGVFDWDDPPLTSDVSDNEEDDHPGEDYNCRCEAAPISAEDAADYEA